MSKQPEAESSGAMTPWRYRMHEVIFEADTPSGKAFDVALLLAITLSILAVMLESVSAIEQEYGGWLRAAEWIFTILFTVEYVLRLACVGQPKRYSTSFFGIVDLLAILPTYVSVLVPGAQSLLVVRALRLLRVFRVLKFGRYLSEANILLVAIRTSRPKIIVFLGTVVTLITIIATVMYLVEGAENGFTSIPRAMYWATTTLTTVGYGDIAPQTPLGQTLATVVMILGYSILAVPTGIMTADLIEASRQHRKVSTQACQECSAEGHDFDAKHCKFCGAAL